MRSGSSREGMSREGERAARESARANRLNWPVWLVTVKPGSGEGRETWQVAVRDQDVGNARNRALRFARAGDGDSCVVNPLTAASIKDRESECGRLFRFASECGIAAVATRGRTVIYRSWWPA